MVLRLAWQASRSSYPCSVAAVSRRTYASASGHLSFSLDLGIGKKDPSSLLRTIAEQVKLTNPSKHNAVVMLVTPQYAKFIDDEGFMRDFVQFISGPEKPDQFHVLSAVVDHVAPSMLQNKPVQGFSIMRGQSDSILPGLWSPVPPKATEDADKVAALTINFGNPCLTIPLANTTFLNHRTSTLIASRFDLGQESPRLIETTEKHWQQITVPLEKQLHSVEDLGLWAPLVPLTHPRVVTESFGNIVRRIDVDNQSTPASNELEPAVDELHRKKSYLVQTSMGVWVMVTPPTYAQAGVSLAGSKTLDPAATFDEDHSAADLVSETSNRLQELYGQGGRLYQILSGGGGWGAKKGLLSLDPQRTHFALSEEEEMQRFIQAMDGGNFVPVGSQIQFFASTETEISPSGKPFSGVIFGTAGNTQLTAEDSTSDCIVLDNHFGALSNEGVFVTSSDAAAETTPGFNNDWRLNVPHSRIFVGTER